ncbi:hypothetical protein ITX44_01455 [Streptomyces sp. KK5PA1]|uniref:Uncharacterized protein n=1 Tax=Actinacidiphila acididurans TaxID=2784346 RepID=A0ABS2TMJ3_9ACTN|nr:hypothetical protein [Actinacidiphila acididurans]
MTWTEAECVEYLESERGAYAWVMQHHGGLTAAEAEEAAMERYPYDPEDASNRGLIFHDTSWHWAMLAIHGQDYVVEHPELIHPSPGYEALLKRQDGGDAP